MTTVKAQAGVEGMIPGRGWGLRAQALVNTVGCVSYLFAQFLMGVVATRLLGYDAAGILALSLAMGNIFGFVQTFGARSRQTSDVSYVHKPLDYIIARSVSIGMGLALCAAVLLVLGYAPTTAIAIALYTLLRTTEAASDVLHGELQRSDRLELCGFSMALRAILVLGLFWYGAAHAGTLTVALALAVAGSAAVTLLFDLPLFLKHAVKDGGGRALTWRTVLIECAPLCVASVLPAAVTSLPRVVLERLHGSSMLGFYGNVSTPAVIITALVPTVLSALMPSYGHMCEEGRMREVRALWMRTLLATCALCAFCMLAVLVAGKPVMALLYTDAIVPYVSYLYPFLASTALYAMTMCCTSAMVALGLRKEVSACSLASLVACMLLSGPLVSRFAIAGAVATLIGAYLVQLLLQVPLVLRATSEGR